MNKAIIEAEIKKVLHELKEARKSKISSWIDDLMIKLERLGLLLECYE